jgi:hypothetical protein
MGNVDEILGRSQVFNSENGCKDKSRVRSRLVSKPTSVTARAKVQKCKSAEVQTAQRQAIATSLSNSNAKVHDDNRHTSMGYSKISRRNRNSRIRFQNSNREIAIECKKCNLCAARVINGSTIVECER